MYGHLQPLILLVVLSKKSKKSSSKTSPESTSESPTEANDAASKSINNVAAAAAAVDPPANQPQTHTGPAPHASLAPLQPRATSSQQSSAPAATIFPNTTPPVSATFPNAWSRPIPTTLSLQTSNLSTSMPAPSSWTAPRPSTAAYMQAPATGFGAPRPAVNLAGTWPQRLRQVVASASPPYEPLSPDFFSLPNHTNRSKYRRRSDQPRSRHRRSNRQSRARAARWLDRPRTQLTLVANAPMGSVPAPLRLKLHSLLASASGGPIPLPPVWRGQKPSDVLDLRFMASGRHVIGYRFNLGMIAFWVVFVW